MTTPTKWGPYTAPVKTRTQSGLARAILPAEIAAYRDFNSLPTSLQGMDTRVIFISATGQLFNLHGKDAGRQGVKLNKILAGENLWPFELVLTEGAFVKGADIERVNINKRMINFGLVIGGVCRGHHLTNYEYRMAEEHWWNSQDENADGWLGVYTRFTGWRWIKVRPAQTVEGAQDRDPVAMDNNTALYDINWIAAKPYYSKVTFMRQWRAVDALKDNDGIDIEGEGIITLANRGDLASHVRYLVSSPGIATVQDNTSERMVELPRTYAADGDYLVDTEPGIRTLTSSTERVDNIFYDRIRASGILTALLDDLGSKGEPLGYGFDKRFMYKIPPRSVVNLRVKHSNPNGVITAFVPQRYKRSR